MALKHRSGFFTAIYSKTLSGPDHLKNIVYILGYKYVLGAIQRSS